MSLNAGGIALKSAANGIIMGNSILPRCSAGNTPGLYAQEGSAALSDGSTEPLKTCPACGESKDRSEFYPLRRNSERLHSHCKTCQKISRKAIQKALKAKRKKIHTEEYYSNAEQNILWEKSCVRCKETYLIRDFYKHRGAVDGFSTSCKKCSIEAARKSQNKDRDRKNSLRKLYGISVEEYAETLKNQGGGCAICGAQKSANGHTLAVDHCHTTGRFRGVLCNSCNVAIGYLKDDPELIRRAANYVSGTI